MNFLETIQINNGKALNLDYHQRRVEQTFTMFFFKKEAFNLYEICEKMTFPSKGIFKFRIEYGENFFETQVIPYEIRNITGFKVFFDDAIEYPLKFANRDMFQSFQREFPSQEIIIIKKGYITDTTYSNLVFYKENQWHTPTTYLLNGTCRQRLLHEKKIQEMPITMDNLLTFEKVGIINAMIDLEIISLDITSIFIP